jgi:hypothetical protein
MLRFERLLLADEQSFVPRLTTGADAYRHGGSSAIPPTASLFRERFIYDEQPFLRGYERATGRFWRKAAVGKTRDFGYRIILVGRRKRPSIGEAMAVSVYVVRYAAGTNV